MFFGGLKILFMGNNPIVNGCIFTINSNLMMTPKENFGMSVRCLLNGRQIIDISKVNLCNSYYAKRHEDYKYLSNSDDTACKFKIGRDSRGSNRIDLAGSQRYLSKTNYTYPKRTLSYHRNSNHECISPLENCSKNCIPSLSFSSRDYNRNLRQSMFSNLLNRLMSSMQPIRSSTAGSGIPIEDEQTQLLANPIVNKRIKINACGQLYSELCKTKPVLYSGAPKERGIDFDLQYYDSLELLKPDERTEARVVCLLHGAPGHYKDFSRLISYLTEKGIRVLAPNFPDYSATYKYSFRHSPFERLDILLKFFEALKVTNIDLMIGHSSAVYTMLELVHHSLKTNDRLSVKSLGFFSTPTYNLPPNMMVTPFRLLTLKLFDYPLFRPVILTLIHMFVKLQGIRNRVEDGNIENLLIAASAVGYSESDRSADHLKLIKKHQLPAFLLVGGNDRLIPMSCFDQLKRDLGITSDEQVKHYDDNGNLVRDSTDANGLVCVSQFASGGHYTFQRFASQVNGDVYDFLMSKVKSGKVESTKL